MLKWTDHFLDWLEERGLSMDDVTQEAVDEYVMECTDRYSHNSMVPITSNLKKLLVYWRGMELDVNVCRPKAPKIDKTPFTKQEVEDMFKEAKYDPLVYAVLKTLYYSGLRNNELRNLDLRDVNFDNLRITVRYGKQDRWRVVNITRDCAAAIKRYLQYRPRPKKKDEEALFVTRQGNRISRSYLREMVKRTASRAGVAKQAYPHKFRITMITHMAESGCGIKEIQPQSGHRDEKTLMGYIQHSAGRIRDVYDRAFSNDQQDKPKSRKERPTPQVSQEDYKEQIVKKFLDGDIGRETMNSMLEVFDDTPHKHNKDIAYG